MIRVTEQAQYNRTVNSIKTNFREMEMSQRRLNTGKRVQYPHQSVTSTVNSIYYRTRISAIDTFQDNIVTSKERLNVAYDSLGGVTDALNRARELTVQAGNSTYNREDRITMAIEIEEMIERVYDLSLTKSKDEYIFSGTSVKSAPFKLSYSQNDDMGRSVISGVTYEGDSTVQNREIENSRYVDVGSPGSFSFWASNTEITSTTDASEYISQTDQKIMIDNTVIDIKEGDNLETIAERINSASAGFEASVVSQRGEGRVLKIQSREPHKLMIQDLEGGTTLQDLGILREGLANITESNYSPSAVVNGKSVFEVLMFTRDSMLKDDVANVGGSALGLLDEALGNVLDNQTKVSSKVSRLDMTDLGFSNQKYATIEALSKNEDIDFSEEILNFNMWQYAHNASLQTAGKLLGRTLMDYLR